MISAGLKAKHGAIQMYIILQRNGWQFATQGCDYVVVNPAGAIVVRDMNKRVVEAQFMQLSK